MRTPAQIDYDQKVVLKQFSHGRGGKSGPLKSAAVVKAELDGKVQPQFVTAALKHWVSLGALETTGNKASTRYCRPAKT